MRGISIKKAATINAVANYSCVVLQLAFSAVLARILSPEDYGTIGVMTVFTTFFSVIANMGIGAAVIQNKELSDEDISSIFSFNFYIALFLAVVFMLFSIPLSHFYGESAYVPIGGLLSIALFFSAMNMIPNALLMKEKKFIRIGVRMIVVTVVGSVAAIVLALLGFKFYALAVQSIIVAVTNFIWNYSNVKIKFSLKFKFSSVRKIFVFSSYQFAFNVFNYFARNSDNLLIAKIMGNESLGYYDKAYRLAIYPEQNLTHVITPVLHPILSDYQHDKRFIYKQYMAIVKVLSLIGMFVGMYMYFSSYEIICIMFGEKWNLAIPCMQMLSLSVWAQVINSSSGAIFQSLGNTKNLFITGVLSSICTLIGILLGVFFGDIETVARNVMISYNINFLISYFMLIKVTFGFSFIKFLKTFIPDVCIAIMVILAGILSSHMEIHATDIFGIIVNAGLKFVIMGAAYVLGLIIFKQYKYLLGIFKKERTD